MESTEYLRSWAEVDLGALRHNLNVARQACGSQCALMAVVKADAYGHGLRRVAAALADQAEWIGVANVDEGLQVVDEGAQRVFVLGPVLPWEREVAVTGQFVVAISTLEEAQAFDALGQELGQDVEAHLVLDTGMGRMGCLEQEFASLLSACGKLPRLRVKGLATHFPSADEDAGFTRHQIAQMEKMVPSLPEDFAIHLSNSAGLLGFAQDQPFATIARPGLMLYGYAPLPEFQDAMRPVLSLKSRVTLVRHLPAGRSISYGRTMITERPATVATVGLGYGDGYPRHGSNQGAQVLVGGRRCPLLGRVTMDQVMVDVSGLESLPEVGDPVVLIGRQGTEQILATEVAEWARTISWEVLTGITRRVRRVYFD